MKNVFRVLLLIALSFTGASLPAAEKLPQWDVRAATEDGEVEVDLATGVLKSDKGVIVRYGDAEMTAGRVMLNQETGEALAEGMVTLQRAGQVWHGDKLKYNFKTEQIEAEVFKTGAPPFFASGFGLAADKTHSVYSAYDAFVTTDDVAEPGYRIRAKSLVIIPGKMLEAKGATVYLGDVPVFYWPYYRRSLERHPNNIELTPGYRSRFGPYLLGAYNWYYNDRLNGSFNLDYRAKRGFGGGPDVIYDAGRFGKFEARYYYLKDDAPGTNSLNLPLNDDRSRVFFSHQVALRTNLTAKTVVRYQSDEFLLRDFFDNEYEKNIQPTTFTEINQLWPNFSLNVLAQPQINDFFDTVERLPDVKLTGLRQQLGVSPFYYESESSAGYYRRQFGNNAFPEFAAWRADTYHQLTLPRTFFGWLNVTPRVGGRLTHYGETEGAGIPFTERDRGVFNTGAEVSFKASRVWRETQSKFWDVNELRHIVQPSVNYVYVPSPNVLPAQLPQFDYELPSFRLLPIEYPDYNAIDSIDSQNVFRFALRNKLQTKRAQGIDNVVNWALYTDWRVHPRAGQGTFADVFSDLDFKPRDWLTLTSEMRYDIGAGHFRQAFHTLTLAPKSNWSLSLGHRYFRDDPALGPFSGNNLFNSTVYYRLNENWAARATHYFEARDGRLEEQFYTLYRDMRSWTGAVTLRLRESRVGPDDITIAVTFSLKAFPRFNVGSDSSSPSLLLGS
ncbi:MAG: LPS assembly protein LptD [Verrucomicrobiota bacterium]